MAEVTHRIIALSHQHADTTATIDWGWMRVKNGWRTTKGELVIYVSEPALLHGLPHNAIVYLGYGWYEAIGRNHALHDALEYCRAHCQPIGMRGTGR